MGAQASGMEENGNQGHGCDSLLREIQLASALLCRLERFPT